jgi:hypothetical protein
VPLTPDICIPAELKPSVGVRNVTPGELLFAATALRMLDCVAYSDEFKLLSAVKLSLKVVA